MSKKVILVVILLTILVYLGTGCSFGALEVSRIRYVFYTEIIKQGTETESNFKILQGKELSTWPSQDYMIKPNVFDIVVEIKNTGLLSVKQPKLHVEFWLSEAPEIFDNESALEIEKMKKLEKWVRNWEKDITLPDFKPLENRKIKIERVRIRDLDESESMNKKVSIMGWKCKVTYGQSKFEKVFVCDFLD